MPDMDGLAVLRYLNQRNIRIPTILITGSSEADCLSDCLNAGAITCLIKPLDADQLIDTIKTIAVPSPTRFCLSVSDHWTVYGIS